MLRPALLIQVLQLSNRPRPLFFMKYFISNNLFLNSCKNNLIW